MAKQTTDTMKTVEGRGMVNFGKEFTAEELGVIAEEAVNLPRVPRRIPFPSHGSRLNIWKQDPSVERLGARQIYLHTRTRQGPRDSQINISGMPTVYPDFKGDFLVDPQDEAEFDAVHTYAVVRMVLTMYQRALREKMSWHWGDSEPIDVNPRAGSAANAFYSRTGKSLRFFFFRKAGADPSEPPIYTCRSLDIVAHEAGHAILDGLKSEWLPFTQPQTGGLHESFGDLTAIFLALSQLDLVEFVIASTKGNLHRTNILDKLAEQFGEGIGRPSGLRNADNDLKLSQVSNQVHDLSQVFTGAVFDILATAFHAARRPRWIDDAIMLYEVGQKVMKLTLEGIRLAPAQNATYKDVADAMIAFANSHPVEFDGYDQIIQAEFTRREVLGTAAAAAPTPIDGMGLDYGACCGTMHHLAEEEEAIAEFGPLREVG